jgi:hypothetical protein
MSSRFMAPSVGRTDGIGEASFWAKIAHSRRPRMVDKMILFYGGGAQIDGHWRIECRLLTQSEELGRAAICLALICRWSPTFMRCMNGHSELVGEVSRAVRGRYQAGRSTVRRESLITPPCKLVSSGELQRPETFHWISMPTFDFPSTDFPSARLFRFASRISPPHPAPLLVQLTHRK